MKAIPTKYNGTHFKSKLEAAWAKWLDDHYIIWDYETQGFDFGGTWYLPDFYLPEINTIIEVKGVMQGIEKPYKFMNELKKSFVRNNGVFYEYYPDDNIMILLAGPVPYFYNICDAYADGFYFFQCSKCGKTTIVTKIYDYSCRACGFHNGMHDVRRGGSLDVLCKPLEWLLLEED